MASHRSHKPEFLVQIQVSATPAQVVKQVDAEDSKSSAARRAGSIPALGTTNLLGR